MAVRGETEPDVELLNEISRRFVRRKDRCAAHDRRQLFDTLQRIPGAKTLVLDPAIAGKLGLITDVTVLKTQAVDKMYYLETGAPLQNAQSNVVYITSPSVRLMRIIAGTSRAANAVHGPN